MATDPNIPREDDKHRYEALLRISEALSTCRKPEELAKTLANRIEKFLQFDHLYAVVLKENSKEIEYRVRGKGELTLPDFPMEELPIWEAISSPDPQCIVHWDAEERSPRFKEWTKKVGLGSGAGL